MTVFAVAVASAAPNQSLARDFLTFFKSAGESRNRGARHGAGLTRLLGMSASRIRAEYLQCHLSIDRSR